MGKKFLIFCTNFLLTKTCDMWYNGNFAAARRTAARPSCLPDNQKRPDQNDQIFFKKGGKQDWKIKYI